MGVVAVACGVTGGVGDTDGDLAEVARKTETVCAYRTYRTHPTSGLKVLSGLRLANLNLKLFEHLQQKQIYLQLVDEEIILQKVIFDEMLRLGVQR